MNNWNGVVNSAQQGAMYGAVGTGVNSAMNGGYTGGLGHNMVRGAEYGVMNYGLNTVQNAVFGAPSNFVESGIRNGVNWGIQNKVMGGHTDFRHNVARGVEMGAISSVMPHSHHGGVRGMVENQVLWNLQHKALDKVHNMFHKH